MPRKKTSSKEQPAEAEKNKTPDVNAEIKVEAKADAGKASKKETKKSAPKGGTKPKKTSKPKKAAPPEKAASEKAPEAPEETAPPKTEDTPKKKKAPSKRSKKPETVEKEAAQSAPAEKKEEEKEKKTSKKTSRGKKNSSVEKPAVKGEKTENTEKAEEKAAERTKKEEEKPAQPEVKTEKAVPLYGKITSGTPSSKPVQPSKKSKEEKPGFFNFGKINVSEVKEEISRAKETAKESEKPETKRAGQKRNRRRNERKRNGEIPAAPKFDRERIFAEVFGFEYEAPKAEKEEKVEKSAEKKAESVKRAEKAPLPAGKEKLSDEEKDAIFASVFGYAPEKKDEKKAEKAEEKPSPKKRKSGVFLLFKNAGKKSRKGFNRKKKEEKEAAQTDLRPEPAEVKKEEKAEKTEVFDRDRIFAEVFGFAFGEKAGKEADTPIQPEKKDEGKKIPPNTMDKDLERLINDSYTGAYPKLSLRKPFTDSEKRWATEFEQFYLSRGYSAVFKISGATKTGVIADKLFKSGRTDDVLRFFQAGKTVAYSLFENGDEEYQKNLTSNKFPRHTFDKRFEPILNTAKSFGLITNFIEQTDGKTGNTHLVAFFSKYQKVLDFFRGEFLEGFGYYVANKVASKIASERKLNYEIAANLVTTNANGSTVHEYDTVIRISNQIFIVEEKSSPYFCDFNKFAQDMDRLQFSKKNYMILLVNKTGEEAEAIEWLFDFRVANIDTFASKLREMIEEGLDDPIPNV